MKKLFAMAALAVAMMMPTTSNAQVKAGLKGGLNLTNMSLSQDALDVENRTGFFIGPTVKFTLPLIGLGIDASALYDQRESKVTDNSATESSSANVKQQSLQVPINLRYGVGLGSLANVFVFAGPQFGFNLGDKKLDKDNYKVKDSNLSVNLGVGATVATHIQVTANYNIACGKTSDVSLKDVTKKYEAKANSWQVGLAYFF